MVQDLLKAGTTPNVTDLAGNTPLVQAAQGSRPRVVEVLLAQGVDVDHRNKDGNSALAWAAFNGNHVIIEDLLNAGARINITNNHGNTPLVLASKMKTLDIVKLLLERGATVTQQDNLGKNCNTVGTPVGTCVSSADCTRLDTLLPAESVNNNTTRTANLLVNFACGSVDGAI
nr:kinase D-interacting substrate of 220 kDa-like [Penaeus vannamei]